MNIRSIESIIQTYAQGHGFDQSTLQFDAKPLSSNFTKMTKHCETSSVLQVLTSIETLNGFYQTFTDDW